jgi:hypothetical protein
MPSQSLQAKKNRLQSTFSNMSMLISLQKRTASADRWASGTSCKAGSAWQLSCFCWTCSITHKVHHMDPQLLFLNCTRGGCIRHLTTLANAPFVCCRWAGMGLACRLLNAADKALLLWLPVCIRPIASLQTSRSCSHSPHVNPSSVSTFCTSWCTS